MRRLLIGPFAYLAALARATRDGWNRFVFTPADPTALGLVRVVAGALAFWSLFVYGLDLPAYLGPDGWADVATVRGFMAGDQPTAWSPWLLVPGGMIRPAWVACLVVLAMFTVGLGSRTTAILAWGITVATARRVPVSLYGFDQINATWLLYLAASGASGQAVSIDRFLARWRRNRAEVDARPKGAGWLAPSGVPEPSISANIGLRLIQCHLVLIYGMAALAKLQGAPWWSGDAFWGTVAAGEFRLFDLTFVASYPLLIQFLTHAGLAIEGSYAVLIWIRPIRPLMIGLAALMHLGIGLTLGLVEFSLAMIAGNVAFASGPWLRSLVAGKVPGRVESRVLYDGACPRCRASMALITAGDPDRLIEPIDLTTVDVTKIHPGLSKAACMESMHVVESSGKVRSGYDAVMGLLALAPLFRPFALARYLPGVNPVGRRVYAWVASTRPRDGCTDDTCGIHPTGSARSTPEPRPKAPRPDPDRVPTEGGRPRR